MVKDDPEIGGTAGPPFHPSIFDRCFTLSSFWPQNGLPIRVLFGAWSQASLFNLVEQSQCGIVGKNFFSGSSPSPLGLDVGLYCWV